MTGYTAQQCVEYIGLIEAALSEVDHAIKHIYVPPPALRAVGTRVQYYPGKHSDGRALWKAASLAYLSVEGPEYQRVCLPCTEAEPRFPWRNCPRYPVGALLAGVIEGCQP